jgi:hypothetical protein
MARAHRAAACARWVRGARHGDFCTTLKSPLSQMGAVMAAPARAHRGGPVGRGQKLFEDISSLPRRQQEKVFEFVEAFVDQYRRKAS